MNCPRCDDHIRIPTYDGRCSTCGNEWLQPYAVDCLKHWNFTSWPSACGRVPREGPTEGLYTAGKRGPYLFACKKRLHKDTYASFSKTLLGAALTGDRKLALFVGTGPYDISDVTVFDARRVLNQATERERNEVDSKQERNVPVYDVSVTAHGVPLGDWLSGAKRLPAPPSTWPTGLDRFGVKLRGGV